MAEEVLQVSAYAQRLAGQSVRVYADPHINTRVINLGAWMEADIAAALL